MFLCVSQVYAMISEMTILILDIFIELVSDDAHPDDLVAIGELINEAISDSIFDLPKLSEDSDDESLDNVSF